MIPTRALFAMALVLGATGCGGSGDSLAPPPGDTTSSSSSSSSSGGPVLPPRDIGCGSDGIGVAKADCSGVYQVSGTLGAMAFQKTYCNVVSQWDSVSPWTVDDVYSEVPDNSTDTAIALFLVNGQGAFPTSPLPGTGVVHLIDPEADPSTDLSGPGQGSRICLADISRQTQTWTASSLSVLSACPGTPTDDSLELDTAAGASFVSGFIGGVGVNGTGGGMGCINTICSFEHCSANALSISGFMRLAEAVPVGGGPFTTQITDVYIALGDEAPRVYCGGSASTLTMNADLGITAVLHGLSSVGTCPGSPIDGTITWSDAADPSPDRPEAGEDGEPSRPPRSRFAPAAAA